MLVTHKVKNESWDMYIHMFVRAAGTFHTIAHDKNTNNKQQKLQKLVFSSIYWMITQTCIKKTKTHWKVK